MKGLAFTGMLRWGLLLGVAILGSWHVESLVAGRVNAAAQREREVVLARAGRLHAQLEQVLSSTVFLAHGLVGFVRAVPDPAPEQVRAALATIHSFDDRIRNIGLAPGNVLRYVYPVAGNETAVGLRYADHPAQWPSVERAMRSGEAVLAGPVELVQGGRAVINRTPVLLSDGSYWGLISIAIDLDRLLHAAGLDAQPDLDLSLRSELLDGRPGPWLAGEIHGEAGDPIRMHVPVPGGTWLLMARPAGGWSEHANVPGQARLTLYPVLLLALGLLWTLMQGQTRARRMAGELAQLNEELSSSNEALQYLSRFDPLTNVANRRYFDEVLARQWATCQRHRRHLSVLMVDVDHFKSINDRYGHGVGDKCLVRVAELILASLQRSDDFAARYGGEEFVVLAPGADPEQALALGDKIRRAIGGTLIEPWGQPDEAFRMTASVGVATCAPGDEGTAAEYCRRADQALYAAKRAGRNRVQHFSRIGM